MACEEMDGMGLIVDCANMLRGWESGFIGLVVILMPFEQSPWDLLAVINDENAYIIPTVHGRALHVVRASVQHQHAGR